MSYRHGVYVTEQDTSMTAPVTGTAGLQVVIGTAPVHMLKNPAEAVNKPLLVQGYKEAVAAVGWSDDFDSYTLCEAISASFQLMNVAPLVLINVLDPRKHSAEMEETTVQINRGIAVLEKEGVLLNELAVKNGDEALIADEDYTASFTKDGMVSITVIAGGKAEGATNLTVSGKVVDPSKVTAADIVGGVNVATEEETGMEVIRQVYPKLGMTPGILIAPRWSADTTVAAVLQAKTQNVNGVFRCVCIADVDSREGGCRKYTDVMAQKEKQALSSPNAYGVWPFARVGEIVYSGSSIAAALTAYTDAANDDTPNVSPSNKAIPISGACLADGSEVVVDQDQANTINGFGIATFLNMGGFRLWGNKTCAYPATTDPKDCIFSTRRFLNWHANTFILTYFQKVDDPMNTRLIEAVVDSENVRGNGFVARGIVARCETVYNVDENPATDLMAGKITFHQFVSPFSPAEVINDIVEFDPNALAAALA